jgi:hypothetical protein
LKKITREIDGNKTSGAALEEKQRGKSKKEKERGELTI